MEEGSIDGCLCYTAGMSTASDLPRAHRPRLHSGIGLRHGLNTTVLMILLVVVAVSPLPLASNREAAWLTWALLIGLATILWGLGATIWPSHVTVSSRRVAPYAATAGLLFAWIVLQATGGLPVAWHHPLWPADGSGRISLSPDASWASLMRLMTYFGVFALALYLGRRRDGARAILTTTAIACAVYATYGLIAHLVDGQHVLWLRKWAYADSLTGPFVNRNAFGAYCGVGLVLWLSLAVAALDRGLAAEARKPDWRDRLLGLQQRIDAAAIARIAILIVLAAALMLTQSRGAVASTAVGIVVLGAVMRLSAAVMLSRLFLALIVALILLVAIATGGSVLDRLEGLDEQAGGRADLHSFTLDRIGERPFLGHGAGSFPDVFRAYRDDRFARIPVTASQAHNSYLEAAMDWGLPAAAMLWAAMAAAVVTGWRGCRRLTLGRDPTPFAALAAGALLACHAMVDFSIQMPAVAITMAALAGAGLSRSWAAIDRRARAARDPQAR